MTMVISKNVIKLIVAAVVVGSTDFGRASDVVSADYMFVLEAKDYESRLQLANGFLEDTYNSPKKNFVYSSQLSTNITGLQTKFSYQLQFVKNQSMQYSFSASITNVSARADEILTRGQIHQQVGSIDAVINVNGKCSDIKWNNPATANLGGSFKIVPAENKIQVVIIMSALQLKADSWNMSAAHCDGFQGYLEQTKEQLKNYLTSSGVLKSQVQTWIQEYIDSQLGGMSSRLLVAQHVKVSDKFKIDLVPKGFKVDSQGTFYLNGKASFQVESPKNYMTVVPMGALSPGETGSRLIFPKQLLPQLVSLFQRGNLTSVSKSVQSWPALKTLFGSRFAQSIYWPDLFQFPLNTGFVFDLSLPTAVQWKSTFQTGNSGTVRAAIETEAVLKVNKPSNMGGGTWMQFRVPLRGNIQLGVTLGTVDFSIQDSSIQLVPSSSSKINRSFFEKEIQSQMTRERVYLPFAWIDLGALGYVLPSYWTASGDQLNLHVETY